MEPKWPNDLKEHLNQRLQHSIRSRGYVYVKVLILYWQGGETGFRLEGQNLGHVLQTLFGYQVEEYAIPTTRSYLQLHNFVTKSLLEAEICAEQRNGTSLVIMHYGGHGDENRGAGEEKRSVWAASDAEDSPLLEWFRIQDDVQNTDNDVLLLLDCCYAAQAGRSRGVRRARMELLAAAAMGVKTPMPGPRSFTSNLINELQAMLSKDGHVLVTDMHRNLSNRGVNLWATPIYVKLASGGHGTIRLEPLNRKVRTGHEEEHSSPFLRLLIRTTETIEKAHIDEIALWLGNDIPKMVTSLQVSDVVMTTTKLHDFVDSIRHGHEPLTQNLDKPALEDISYAWDNVASLVEQYNSQCQRTGLCSDELGHIQKRAASFLQQLSARNAELVDAAQRNILNSPESHDGTYLQDALQDPSAKTLGLIDQLRLRKIVSSSAGTSCPNLDSNTAEFQQITVPVMDEYKYISNTSDPADMEYLTSRVQRLAELLNAQKDVSFLALTCLSWHREALESRFVFKFAIPTCYRAEPETCHTLQSLIHSIKGAKRPSLDERFHVAVKIAKAVLKWHSVGWVHQGISSPNIIFFTKKHTEIIDYENPFLQGFDFARPKSDPSLGRRAIDVRSDVYRHPKRQGVARVGHLKVHDIYSLGVVLLEIGLWQKAYDVVIDKKEKNMPTPEQIKERLLQATHSRLAHYAGTAYQSAVRLCLDGQFGINLDDRNDSHLARAFQHNVIDKLASRF